MYVKTFKGLNFANVTMMGYVFLKGGNFQFVLLFPTLLMVELFKGHIESFYVKKAESLGRKEAVALDKCDGDDEVERGGITEGSDKAAASVLSSPTTSTSGGGVGSARNSRISASLLEIREELNNYRQPCLLHRGFESSIDKMRLTHDQDHHSGVLSESQFQTSNAQHAF
jgi:hypothetical protein